MRKFTIFCFATLFIVGLVFFVGKRADSQVKTPAPDATPSQSPTAIQSLNPSPSPTSSIGPRRPNPPLLNVPEDRLIKPGEGVAGARFGMRIEEIEKIMGRGEIRPDETDFFGNTSVNLIYKDKGLVFKFFNGEMVMIVIDSPEFATKGGSHVGGDLGDAIREFGQDFRQEKSIVQDPDPNKQEMEIFFDKKLIAFKCTGIVIDKIRLRTPKPPKPKTKK